MSRSKLSVSKQLASVLMRQVRWQQPMLTQHGIDQTRLVLEGAPTEAVPFSFLVMGDTDAGGDTNSSACFAEGFAQQLMAQGEGSQFLLHTGDVTYPTGSYENYFEGFLRPYRSLLSAMPESPKYGSHSVVFARPLLPVPGNHDYATTGSQVWQRLLRGLCDRLRQHLNIDLGHYGGQGGEGYGQTFLDDLARLSPEMLKAHLADHYRAGVAVGSDEQVGLRYRAGHFTRLPNRYYRFRCGGVDFFALDSNTWNTSPEVSGFDQAQLIWLEQSLLKSWQTPGTVGRVIYLHHSPYTTEVSRCQQSETLWVRRHLRGVLARVSESLSRERVINQNQRRVDLVISGHAHCLEHLQTLDATGGGRHADSGMDWVVCGGSGVSVRPRWRSHSHDILENVTSQGRQYPKVVAKSRLYVGSHTKKNKKQSLYSFIRVEVRPNQRSPFRVVPYVVSRGPTGWQTQPLAALNTYSKAATSGCYA